jgi:hypothetical protein
MSGTDGDPRLQPSGDAGGDAILPEAQRCGNHRHNRRHHRGRRADSEDRLMWIGLDDSPASIVARTGIVPALASLVKRRPPHCKPSKLKTEKTREAQPQGRRLTCCQSNRRAHHRDFDRTLRSTTARATKLHCRWRRSRSCRSSMTRTAASSHRGRATAVA